MLNLKKEHRLSRTQMKAVLGGNDPLDVCYGLCLYIVNDLIHKGCPNRATEECVVVTCSDGRKGKACRPKGGGIDPGEF